MLKTRSDGVKLLQVGCKIIALERDYRHTILSLSRFVSKTLIVENHLS